MNVTTDHADLRFRDEVRRFLDENLSPRLRAAGQRATSVFSDFDCAMAWQSILHAKGWLVPDWPVEYGGTGWDLNRRNIFRAECLAADAPSLVPMGLQMLGPMLIRYGSEEQKRTLLPRILSGEDRWCQGYSEPGAGSDLASLQMRAGRDGDNYILNGTKIWTSQAHHSNRIFCLVRTRTDGPPQRGISFVLVDLATPGISVAPIVGNDGQTEQCQVFFDDVVIPVSARVGDENQGWEIAKYLLEFERGAYSYYLAIGKQFKLLGEMTHANPAFASASSSEAGAFALRAAELEIDTLALECTEHRLRATLSDGQSPGVLSSLIKVFATELSQQVDELLVEARGAYACVWQNEILAPDYGGAPVGPSAGRTVANAYLNNRASTIYGGAAQIQRNIIARQVLGL